MDFVKREDQNLIDEESYKAYAEYLQKQQQQMDLIEYQHTPISMEQLHQAMQSTLTASSISNISHNLQIPLSPRQMSTLMLKTNQLSRNLHFADIPTHLQRNLSSEIELTQNSASEVNVSQNLARHEDLRLPHNALSRNLMSDIDLQHSIGLAQNLVQSLADQMDLSRNLSAETLRTDFQQVLRVESNELNHELDLSHHNVNRNAVIEQELLEDSRRTPVVQCVPDMILDQSISQRLSSHNLVDPNARIDNDHLIPMPFQIKSEQEDEGYFYVPVNQGFANSGNGMNGHIPINAESSQSNPNLHQDSQLYGYNQHIGNINTPSLSPINLYSRPPSFVQNYSANNANRDNPQNLVVHRQFENHSPYPPEEYKRKRQDDVLGNGAKSDRPKLEQPKENLKPSENKIYYGEYSQNVPAYAEKNENDSSEHNKMDIKDDSLSSVNIKGEYVCYKCNDVFPTKRGLKQHTKSCSENGENTEAIEKSGKFSCTLCAYRCQSPAILRIHERTHTGEKPFSCTFCDYKSGQKNNVAKHILVHMKEKPFSCQYCEYRCAQKNNLVVHERTHTGYKPFACPYCDYRTVQKPNLVKHMYLHTDKKPFSCDICNYRCVQKTNLTKHKQRHLNEREGEKVEVKNVMKAYRPRQKSVKCPHCTYKCVQKSSLDKHMQFKHADTNQMANAEFSQQIFEHGLNLMKTAEVDETIQNLSVKKDAVYASEVSCEDKTADQSQS